MSKYQQPSYRVRVKAHGYEVRTYDSYLAAETTVSGDFDSTGNTAFRRLAGFIFGNNAQNAKMKMTVPVTREQAGEGRVRYRFVMERAYSEVSLPRPVDPHVEIVRIPAGDYAALRYRGRRNEATYLRAATDLVAALQRDGWTLTGKPISAVYNGPFTPPPLRHNEVLVPVAMPEEDTGMRSTDRMH